jgi:hypothetical protein
MTKITRTFLGIMFLTLSFSPMRSALAASASERRVQPFVRPTL